MGDHRKSSMFVSAYSGHLAACGPEDRSGNGGKGAKTPAGNQMRKWLRIDAKGSVAYVTADKHTLVTELGVPSRDLRILDPNVATAYPTSILIRPKAIMVHLEGIRMIICRDQALLISVPTPAHPAHSQFPTPDSPFVVSLASRFASHAAEAAAANREPRRLQPAAGQPPGQEGLPLELLALEAALAACCRGLDAEATEAELHVLPVLERLSQKVTRVDLEDVRNHKATLNRLHVRVSKLKQVIEAILDDDHDMQDMYLGRRAEIEQALAAQQAEELKLPESDLQEPEPAGPGKAPRGSQAGPSTAESAAGDEQQPGGSEQQEASLRTSESVTAGADSFTALLQPDGSPGGRESDWAFLPRKTPQTPLGRLSEEGGVHRERGSSAAREGAPPQLGRSLSRASTQVARSRVLGATYHRHLAASAQELQRISAVGAGGEAAALPPDEMQTIVWTRDLSKVDPREIEGCEDLLDAYFMMADSTLSRITVLQDKVEASDTLVTQIVNQRRNDLVAFDLVMSIATTCMAFTSMTASIFGQNLFFNASNYHPSVFLAATLPSLAVTVTALVGLLLLAKQRQLLFQ